MADWTALATNSVSQTTFVETNAANFSSRFYRLSSLAGVGSIQTVWIVMMENTDWSTFPDNSDAPYINSLLPRFAHAENYRSFNHPSLPNYIAIKQIPPAKIAQTLNLKVDQVYLIKHRLTKIFEEALKELETKLG